MRITKLKFIVGVLAIGLLALGGTGCDDKQKKAAADSGLLAVLGLGDVPPSELSNNGPDIETGTTSGDTSGDDTSGGDTPGDDTSGDDTSGDDTSGDDTSGDDDPAPPPGPCTMTGAYIIDLNQGLTSNSGSCSKIKLHLTTTAIADCVEERLRANLPAQCLSKFDVFVPGTAAENGGWRQFNSMFNQENGRGHISVKYQNGSLLDMATYDQGVLDARVALRYVLYTLKHRFNTTDVRVFGHSKGSHAVALVADDPSGMYNYAKFFAFAQAGRTSVDIDERPEIKKGKRGTPGYIHKLSANLVGITWKNDEVQDYTGSGYNGAMMPERWGFPGYINQATTHGTLTSKFRIDHHNNYGGIYTDGVSTNPQTGGYGTTKTGYPYCMAGDKSAYDDGSCDKQRVSFSPYFWGHSACVARAFYAMDNWSPGSKHYIGYSGPRTGDCRESTALQSVDYVLKYKIEVRDKNDCDYKLKFKIQRLDGTTVSTITANSGAGHDNFIKKTGTINVPYHIKLRIDASMTQQSGFGDCYSVVSSKTFIRYLRFDYRHPATNVQTRDYIIRGWNEGKGYFDRITGNNNVAWWRINSGKSRDTWDLYHDHSDDAIKISGGTDENRHGSFYKRVHLLD